MNAIAFIHELAFKDVPEEVVRQAKRCLLDLVGVAAAGLQTDLSRIVRDFAVRQMGTGERGARILFDGRQASPAGAAYAGASTIDAFDAHDGHALTKGHAGVAVLPALLSTVDPGERIDGREFLVSLILGYEIATRAGIALHSSASDYHTSGAWNALGCAAVAARRLGLNAAKTRHALGTAEYHGPRSQMMRCIDHPTMLKDGSGWGAFAGVSAAYLAADGFTGAPAITVEAEEHRSLWSDLGTRWRILEQYLKPHPVCRWAQPAVEAADALMARHEIRPERIARVRVETFGAAVRLGSRAPATTEEAQYAIGFPLAAMLVRRRIGAAEVTAEGLRDPAVLRMAQRIVLQENEAFTRRFPAERVAVVTIEQDDGATAASAPTTARGDPESPLGDDELLSKFRTLADSLDDERRLRIEDAIVTLDRRDGALETLLEMILAPIEEERLLRRISDARPWNSAAQFDRDAMEPERSGADVGGT
jgi:2-methylcitrate dehydratase PrpD